MKNLTLVISLDNPETLEAILQLIEPFREEISVSIRDSGASPIMMAHVEHLGIGHSLEMALAREQDRGIILVCGGNLPPRRGEMAEMFTDKLKEINRSIDISKERLITEEKDRQQEVSFNKQPQKHWGSKQTNNYKSKVPRKFINRTRKR
ncbi:MAG: hypothetical protein WAW11_02050 [Patescibacteria group bacterium]